MMETEKSAEGKAELAQAQSRDEQRKISSAHFDTRNGTVQGGPNNSLPAIHSQHPQIPAPTDHYQPHQPPQPQSAMTQSVNPAFRPQPQSFQQPYNIPVDNGATYPAEPLPQMNPNNGNPPSYGNDLYPYQPPPPLPNNQNQNPNGYSALPGSYGGGPQTNPSLPQTYSNQPYSEQPNTGRHRRVGRDHTNFVMPSNLSNAVTTTQPVYLTEPPHTTGHNEGDLTGRTDKDSYSVYDSEGMGLELVVLDKTDDEDEMPSDRNNFAHPGQTHPPTGPGYPQNVGGEVFPVDNYAVDRDMYKQELATARQPGFQHNHSNNQNTFGGINANENMTSSSFDSDTTAQDTNRSDNHPALPPNQFQLIGDKNSNPYGSYPNHNAFRGDIPQAYANAPSQGDPSKHRPQDNKLFQNPQNVNHFDNNPYYNNNNNNNNNNNRHGHPQENQDSLHPPLYSMSQIDYDRFTSIPSALSTIREGGMSQLDTYRTDNSGGDKDDIPANQGFPEDPNAQLVNSSYPVAAYNQLYGPPPDFKIRTRPGYKFEVSDDPAYTTNRATRANILSRAEQLVEAVRVHSEANRRLNDRDEDEANDDVHSMRDVRMHALRHINRRVYDDTASYNSSDDVLNNIHYQPRGPVSKAARRARLTSVNARLTKQKRIKAGRRMNLRAPISDADNTSEDDVMDPPLTYRRPLEDDERYEDAFHKDGNDVDHLQQLQLQQQQLQQQGGGPVTSDGVVAKGRIVFFYRNGDVHYKPKQVLINSKRYLNLSILLVDLSGMVATSTGVKHIFSWPEGQEIKSITEFEHGKMYVCSSTKKLQRVDYGNSRENQFKHGKVDRKENYLFQKDGKIQSPLRRPRVLTIISNMYRDSREKLILNTNSTMNFEDILTDIVNMVNIPNPPVRALYTERKPHTKVESYSQLIRDFADHENFLACGEEMIPLELAAKRDSEGVTRKARKKQLAGVNDMSRHRDTEDYSPTRSSDAAVSDRTSSTNKQQTKMRRKKTDSVRVDINGKTREFFPPTTIDEEDDGLKPDKKLRLDWVYGFRGRDVKQNLSVLPSSGELVYFVAAVVVVYDKKFASQKHYLGHSEEITCLTIHPNGRFVATGQTAGKTPESGAHVRIWDGVSLSTYAVIGLGMFQQGITCVNFSEKDSQQSDMANGRITHSNAKDYQAKGEKGENFLFPKSSGDLLMAIDDSERHVLTVWEWQTEKMVAKTTTTPEPVVSGCFFPFDDSILVTFGKEHIHFWRMFSEKGKKIMRDKLSGNFEDDVPKFVTSICFSPSGDVITGDSTGAILVWTRDNNSVFSVNDSMSVHTKRAHKKSVSALCMLGDGTLLSGGGNEVKAWDSINNYNLVKERVLPETAGHVRSIVPISMGGLDGSIYVATTRNKVLEGSLQLKFKLVIQGHVEELWAIESHPLEQTFVSAGHDQAVVKWSSMSHAPVWRVNVENPCTSISIDPKGRLIALGTTSGKVVILNSYNGIQLTTLLSGTAQINALSFSPDGMQLAVGTFDGQIQIFYVQDEGHHFFRSQSSSMKCSNIFIMHLDWSIDGKMIQAVMGDYDIAYWDVTTMKRIKGARSLRDVKWVTHNCPIGHSIIGPWQNMERGDVINVVSRSQYRDLMVVGDSRGRLRLYKWPCSVPKAGFRNTKIFSSNVTCAVFSCDDNYVIASGGNDAALMQFSVLDPVNAR